MSSTYALQTRPIALDLYALLRAIDPALWSAETAEAARAQIDRLRAAVGDLLRSLERLLERSSPDEALNRLRAQVLAVEELLRAQAARAASALLDEQAWTAFRAAMTPAYESLAGVLRAEAIHVPSLRPTNYRRNVMHVVGGFLALAFIQAMPGPRSLIASAAAFFLYAWSMEFFRRRSPAFNARVMRLYGPVAHPHEWHRINSATWYCTALLFLALTGSPLVCSVAVLVLGVGDPAAALVGRRFGRIRLLHGRSLEGSLTFVAVSTLVAGGAVALLYPAQGLGAAFFLGGVGAGAGALAELLSRRVDDNLTIPLAAGFAVFMLTLLGG